MKADSFCCRGTACRRCLTFQKWLCAGWATGLKTRSSLSHQSTEEKKLVRRAETQTQTLELLNVWNRSTDIRLPVSIRKPAPLTTPRTPVTGLQRPADATGKKEETVSWMTGIKTGVGLDQNFRGPVVRIHQHPFTTS